MLNLTHPPRIKGHSCSEAVKSRHTCESCTAVQKLSRATAAISFNREDDEWAAKYKNKWGGIRRDQ